MAFTKITKFLKLKNIAFISLFSLSSFWFPLLKNKSWISLMVQWVKSLTPNAGGWSSVPGQGTTEDTRIKLASFNCLCSSSDNGVITLLFMCPEGNLESKVGEVNEEQSLEVSEKSCFTKRSVNTLFVSTYVQQPFLEIALKKLLT